MNFPHPFQVGTTVFAQQYGEGKVIEVAPNADHPELGIVTVDFGDFAKARPEYGPPTFWVTGVEVSGIHAHPTLSLHRNWSEPTTTIKLVAGSPVVAIGPRGNTLVGFYCDRMTEGAKVTHYIVPADDHGHPMLFECCSIVTAFESPDLITNFPKQVATAVKSTADDYDEIPF